MRGVPIIALVALGLLACRPPNDLGLDKELEDTVIPVRPLGEEQQVARGGEAVERMRQDARPDVTVYDPPPDLSRYDIGAVYVPSGPPASPTTQDTIARPGPTPGPPPVQGPGMQQAPADTAGVRPQQPRQLPR